MNQHTTKRTDVKEIPDYYTPQLTGQDRGREDNLELTSEPLALHSTLETYDNILRCAGLAPASLGLRVLRYANPANLAAGRITGVPRQLPTSFKLNCIHPFNTPLARKLNRLM